MGDVTGAIRNYEAAETHRTEVPRMLFDKGRLEDLEGCVCMYALSSHIIYHHYECVCLERGQQRVATT